VPKQLIVTADDFGVAVPVNEAVELGHRNGILTGASLMVTAPAAADAVERARRLPGLGVGLHVVLVDGRPALPPEQIPDLVQPNGRFFNDVLRIAIPLYTSRRVQAQAEAEVRAQLEAFRRTGLRLDRVDGHHHFHLHPTLQRILVRLAPEYGIGAMRLPREPFAASWTATHERAAARLMSWCLLRGRTATMQRRLERAGIRFNDTILGLNDSGHMTPRRVRQFLAALPEGTSELYMHPATGRWGSVDPLPDSYEPEQEYAALVDPGVKETLKSSGAVLTTFAALVDGLARP
jgi:hopanoid biosynthesis associated protein HpnK